MVRWNMPKRSSKDENQLAASIVAVATGVEPPSAGEVAASVSAAAAALGRLGGLKGGPARAAALTPAKRRKIAKKAAAARWNGAKK